MYGIAFVFLSGDKGGSTTTKVLWARWKRSRPIAFATCIVKVYSSTLEKFLRCAFSFMVRYKFIILCTSNSVFPRHCPLQMLILLKSHALETVIRVYC